MSCDYILKVRALASAARSIGPVKKERIVERLRMSRCLNLVLATSVLKKSDETMVSKEETERGLSLPRESSKTLS